MSLRIEIGKTWKKNCWRLRIGDVDGSTEHSMISQEEVLKEINDLMKEERSNSIYDWTNDNDDKDKPTTKIKSAKLET